MNDESVIDVCDCAGAGCEYCEGRGALLVREHEDSEQCWCHPTLEFVAENGTKVWLHHEPN
jgi:hypothetical protein